MRYKKHNITRMGSTSTGETAQKTEKQPLNSSSFSLLQIDLFKSDLPHVTDRQTAKFLTASRSGLLPGLLLTQRTAPSSLNAKQFGFPLPEPCLATFTSQIKIESLISIYIVRGSRADRFPRGSVAWRWQGLPAVPRQPRSAGPHRLLPKGGEVTNVLITPGEGGRQRAILLGFNYWKSFETEEKPITSTWVIWMENKLVLNGTERGHQTAFISKPALIKC